MNPDQQKLLKQLAQMGDVVLIKDGNRIDLDENAKIPLKTQADAVLYFLQRLDIGMLKLILEDNRTYQNFEKPLFIKKLGNALNEFIANENTYLNRHEGYCIGDCCNFKSKGFSFIGNKSEHYFDLIIDVKDGVVHDIYECKLFKSSNHDERRMYRIDIEIDYFPF